MIIWSKEPITYGESWYSHHTPEHKNIRISDFKSEFSGNVVRHTDCYLGVAPKRKALVLARPVVKKSMGRDLWIQKLD